MLFFFHKFLATLRTTMVLYIHHPSRFTRLADIELITWIFTFAAPSANTVHMCLLFRR